MSYKTRLAFDEILLHTPALQAVRDKISKLLKANQLVQSTLDKNLAEQCQVANIRRGVLVLMTPSPALRHQLRFKGPEVLSALRAHPEWCHIKSISTMTQPLSLELGHRASGILPGPKRLSPESIACLRATATHVSSHHLQKALSNLAQHASGVVSST